MKIIFDKVLEFLRILLPFLRKKDAKELREFSDLIISQYGFLVEQLEKALKDYFGLSGRLKDLHTEVVGLREQLATVLPACCYDKECPNRQSM